jgi:hypothetical protein
MMPASNVHYLHSDGAQLRLPFDVIRLNKTMILENDHHMKPIACSKVTISIVDDLLADYSKRFKRFHYAKYFEALSTLLANLFYAYGHNNGVLYSRDTGPKGDKLILGLVDYLAECGLVESIIQPPNESGCSSFAIPLPELKRRLDIARVRIAKGKNHKPVILRDEKKKESSTVEFQRNTPNKYKQLSRPADSHNDWWDNNSVTLYKRPILPALHRVFNNLRYDHGGRFYGSYQSIPSKDRPMILFNGKPTVEIDFSSMHIAILYARAGVAMIGDAYAIEGYTRDEDRDPVKAIMLRLVNTENMSSLEAIITNSAKESRKAEFSKYKKERAEFEKDADAYRKAKPPYKKPWIDSHIENIPTGFNAKKFIQSLHKHHSAISHLLGSKDIGLRLQADDSALMGAIMNDLYSRKNPVPVLPVHDSLICRKTNEVLVKLTMKHYFREMFGASIEVKVTKRDLEPAPEPDNSNHTLDY